VADALDQAPPGSALFVVHGRGSGAVREAVWRLLGGRAKGATAGQRRVAAFREDPGSRGEATVVWLAA
jgi:hypothetical protein